MKYNKILIIEIAEFDSKITFKEGLYK